MRALWLLPAAGPEASSAPSASPAPTQAGETRTLAFLGSTKDPLCAALYGAAEELCRQEGWRLISYDCRGGAANQRGQLEDLLRNEKPDGVALFSVLEQEELDEQVKALSKLCPVVTVGREAGRSAGRYVAAHIGADEEAQTKALAEHVQKTLSKGQGALLITDLPEENGERRYRRAFSAQGVELLDHNYTWGAALYAQRYLETALDQWEDAGAVVCGSHLAAAGAHAALEEQDRRGELAVVALNWEAETAEDLLLGTLDAAVTVSPREAGERLQEVLPPVLRGEKVEPRPLTPVVLTPETVGESEWG